MKKHIIILISIIMIGAVLIPNIAANLETNILNKTIIKSGILNDGKNLVAYWSFDEGSGTIAHDNSGNGFDGTISGANWIPGYSGTGLEFSSTGDIVEGISASLDNSISDYLSIECWIYWYGYDIFTNCIIFDGRSGVHSNGRGFILNILENKLHFKLQTPSGSFRFYSNSLIQTNEWIHVKAVYDYNLQEVSIYLNDVLDNISTYSNPYYDSSDSKSIGNNHWGDELRTFNGIIDELKIYNDVSEGDEGVIFFDDFNDNIKDYTKWTEIFADGEWEEINQRCEFKLYEPGRNVYQGIKSTNFTVQLNPNTPLIVNWDLISDIGSTNWAGVISLKLTDGTNYIKAGYWRWESATLVRDSDDDDWTYLDGNTPDGTYNSEIQVYSDRYIVRIGEDTSPIVYQSIFTPGLPLYIEIYLASGGSQPNLYLKSGFDNILVQFEDYIPNEPPTALFFFKPLSPSTKMIVNFNDYSTDIDGRIVSWWWDFGNGYYSDIQNPVFQYRSGGTYTISLTVIDDDGATDTFEREITVLDSFMKII
jgi:PKD repeat protein